MSGYNEQNHGFLKKRNHNDILSSTTATCQHFYFAMRSIINDNYKDEMSLKKLYQTNCNDMKPTNLTIWVP